MHDEDIHHADLDIAQLGQLAQQFIRDQMKAAGLCFQIYLFLYPHGGVSSASDLRGFAIL
jgi:hypothetical protein